MPKSPKKLDDESSLVADAKQREKERAATNRLVLEFLLKPHNLFKRTSSDLFLSCLPSSLISSHIPNNETNCKNLGKQTLEM